jgi:3-hydroxyacyl-[acyl-carrier-protein] dehydratase
VEDKVLTFDIPEIMECQKNRYPMLFIDKITECVPLNYAKGYKLFSYNEWYFHGYDIDSPKVWNVIQIEAMAQIFLMTFLTTDENMGKVAVSNRYNKVNFYRKIEPGEKLNFEARLDSFKHGIARGKIEGNVGGERACSMEATIVVPELFSKFQRRLPESATKSVDAIDINEYKINFGIEKIMECMLNKYPWLFLDGVLEIQPGKFVKAIKNFTYNEKYFPVHFPNDPSVPGFIQIECCMQAFLLTFLSQDEYKKSETADRLLDNVYVKRKIIPGDTMLIIANLNRFTRGIAKGRVESYVNGEKAVSFDVTAVVVNELDKFKPKLKG